MHTYVPKPFLQLATLLALLASVVKVVQIIKVVEVIREAFGQVNVDVNGRQRRVADAARVEGEQRRRRAGRRHGHDDVVQWHGQYVRAKFHKIEDVGESS